jgi:tetratricopeptide (TPR) repeat protein
VLFEEGKWRETIGVARRATKRWPNEYHAYTLIARSYAELGHWKMAERFFRRALKIKQTPAIWVLLADAVENLGKYDEAEKCVRQALKVDPDYEEAHFNLGHIYRLKGKSGLAEKYLKRAIEIDPKYALAYAELGQLLCGQNRPSEAASLLRKAVKYDPSDGWSTAYLANSLWKLRKLKAADEQYRRLIQLWPDSAVPYWCYGSFLAYESKDNLTAEGFLRRGVEIDPGCEMANYNLGNHLLWWDRETEGKKFLTKAAKLGHPRARELLQKHKS